MTHALAFAQLTRTQPDSKRTWARKETTGQMRRMRSLIKRSDEFCNSTEEEEEQEKQEVEEAVCNVTHNKRKACEIF